MCGSYDILSRDLNDRGQNVEIDHILISANVCYIIFFIPPISFIQVASTYFINFLCFNMSFDHKLRVSSYAGASNRINAVAILFGLPN